MNERSPKTPSEQEGQPSAGSCRSDIAILFSEPIISRLFAELLLAMGESVRILHQVRKLAPGERVVTEVKYAGKLGVSSPTDCVVVGDPTALADIDAIRLPQPLSEEGVESALAQLLRR